MGKRPVQARCCEKANTSQILQRQESRVRQDVMKQEAEKAKTSESGRKKARRKQVPKRTKYRKPKQAEC